MGEGNITSERRKTSQRVLFLHSCFGIRLWKIYSILLKTVDVQHYCRGQGQLQKFWGIQSVEFMRSKVLYKLFTGSLRNKEFQWLCKRPTLSALIWADILWAALILMWADLLMGAEDVTHFQKLQILSKNLYFTANFIKSRFNLTEWQVGSHSRYIHK